MATQVIVNEFPPAPSAVVDALTPVGFLFFAMVIRVSDREVELTGNDPSTVAPLKFTEPKSAIGTVVHLVAVQVEGSSAIHSADSSSGAGVPPAVSSSTTSLCCWRS